MSVTTMPAARAPRPSSLADVLDVILDKGIVIDLYVRVSLIGIEVLTIDARIVIASVDTYLRFAEAVNRLDLQPRGQVAGLPGMIEQVREGGAESKTKGALSGAKEKVSELTGRHGSDDDEDSDDERAGGGRSKAGQVFSGAKEKVSELAGRRGSEDDDSGDEDDDRDEDYEYDESDDEMSDRVRGRSAGRSRSDRGASDDDEPDDDEPPRRRSGGTGRDRERTPPTSRRAPSGRRRSE